MKILFLPSKYTASCSLKNIKPNKLPETIGLITTIQHTNSLEKIKAFLEKHKKKVIIGKSKFLEKGQILGCNVKAAISIQDKVQAFLYIGSGKFHPLQLALATNKPIYIYNPLTNQFSKLKTEDINKAKARKKGQKLKFLSAQTYGILVSIKPGQNKLKQAMELKKKLEKQKKKAYIFTFDTLDINQLENFPKIQCWINTACPGLSLEQPFVWYQDF
ncbi:MAG: diphthamide synthesis protein [Candidatus Pacearchaeota archaeon]|nr:MAG: diphthamide synthesis protein [Candidatus Pacearchaeota archaeon]